MSVIEQLPDDLGALHDGVIVLARAKGSARTLRHFFF